MRAYIIQANSFNLPLEDNSIHCVVTSPPYFALRHYATVGVLGEEATLDAYINNSVKYAREIRRVLRPDGTFWLNIGDTFINKELQLVPHRVAIALQDSGWILRSEIIWRKTNPMPEGDTSDRPHREHETIFLFTKSRDYFYDAEAIREKYEAPLDRWGGDRKQTTDNLKDGSLYEMMHRERDMRPNPNGRHRRTVWEFPTSSYPGAHYATFHQALPELCIKAGTSEYGVCSNCGAPWERQLKVERGEPIPSVSISEEQGNPRKGGATYRPVLSVETIGWKPTCKCKWYKIKSDVPQPVIDKLKALGYN